jgi:pimeloyl-ACP methyl ester carboxylesterase
MDAWDPAVTNGLAADYEVILLDNAGVGASGGETPSTVAEMAQHVFAFCEALDLKTVDSLRFLIGRDDLTTIGSGSSPTGTV